MDFSLNIFAIIILISLLVVIYLTRDTINIKSRLFRMMILLAIFMNATEILSWIFDGKPGNLNYFLNFTFNFLFTAINLVVVGLWACYIDYQIFRDYEKLKQKWYYFLPAIIMFVLSIVNIFYPILFTISEENVYSRLPLLWTSIPLLIISYIFVLVLASKNNKEGNNRVIIGVIIFLSLPIIAAIIQLQFIGLFLIWPTTALAILISYLIFETTANSKDYLTGLFTRERAEELIQRHIFKTAPFSVMMLDIDDFKNINDTEGHHTGDLVLIEIARILQKQFDRKTLVSRYGGDEFLIVLPFADEASIKLVKKNIIDEISKAKVENIHDIKMSFGVAICNNTEDSTIKKVIIEADNDMYRNKGKLKKQEKEE